MPIVRPPSGAYGLAREESMDCKALVQEAAARFEEGDDEALVACFDPGVTIYSEPELSGRPIVRSRAELAARLESSRRRRPGVTVTVCNVEAHGDGVVADAIITAATDGDEIAWRLALAIRVTGESISEVRPFWRRDAALGSITGCG
jgi:ketosteroid isomerase-like protein